MPPTPRPLHVSTTIYPTPEQREQLRALNSVTKVPWSVYVRDGIDMVIEDARRKGLLP